MNKLVLFSSLAVSGAALAAPPADAPKPAEAPQQVTVSGSRGNDIDQRRNATAAKMIFGREELERNGDGSVGEMLKRVPGVTMGGPPGRGGAGAVRMRGLGNGYPQMLVNGERPPAGSSLDALAPDQVERIEIMRGAVAEHSTQAIAGTINIVLREGYQQKDLQLKLSDTVANGRHSPSVSPTMPGKAAGTQGKDQTIATTGERASRGAPDAALLEQVRQWRHAQLPALPDATACGSSAPPPNCGWAPTPRAPRKEIVVKPASPPGSGPTFATSGNLRNFLR